MSCNSQLPSWPATLQTLALVVSPRLGLQHTHYVEIPILLQVQQAEGGDLDNNSIEQLMSFKNDEMNTRWREICQRIQVDPSLDK